MKPDHSLADKFTYSGTYLAKGSFGSFASCLGDAMLRAGSVNALKLYEAFPDIFEDAWTYCSANKDDSTIKESV